MEEAIEKLLDENNSDPIVLYNTKGEEVVFEQIAVIPYNKKVYCILTPVEETDGVKPGEGVVFEVLQDEETKAGMFEFVYDRKLVNKIFKIYEDMLADIYD